MSDTTNTMHAYLYIAGFEHYLVRALVLGGLRFLGLVGVVCHMHKVDGAWRLPAKEPLESTIERLPDTKDDRVVYCVRREAERGKDNTVPLLTLFARSLPDVEPGDLLDKPGAYEWFDPVRKLCYLAGA